MTPKEEQWLAEYHRQEARQRVKRYCIILGFWCVIAVIWLIYLFWEPDRRFSFIDSLFLMTILINGVNAVKEILDGKRIASGRKSAASADRHRTDI